MRAQTFNIGEESLRSSRSREILALWFGILAGPLAWALDQGISYMLTPHACSTGHFYVLHITTLLMIALSLAGLWTAWTLQHSLPHDATEDGSSVFDRSRFMANLGLLMSFGFTLVIIALAVPKWILSPCE